MLVLLLLSACFTVIKEFKFKNIDKVNSKMLEMKELGIGSAFDLFKNDLLDLLKRSEMPEDRGLITKLLKNESNKFSSQLNEVEDTRLSELLRYSALTSNSIFFNIIEILNKKDLLEKTLLERDSRGRTALHFAFLSKNFVLCEYLLKYSPISCRGQLVATDDSGLNCLHYLAFSDLFEEYVEGSKENTIKFKLERNKFKNFSEYLALLSNDTIIEKDEKGLTPMHYAAYFGNLDLCKSILKHSNQEKTEILSAKSERVKDLGELTPLDLAYLANEVDMIDYLEKEIKIYEGKGTKVFKLDDKNRIFKCALRSSLKTGEFALVDRYLKKYYSSKDARKDYTKLSKESLLYKNEKNSDLNCLGEKIRSLEASLMIDEEKVNEEIMEILTILQKSVDLGINNELIYSEDADGKTSIHFAVNNTNILEILYSYSIKNKVIKSVKDKLGRTPLHYASLSPKFLKSIEIIKKFSPADILIVDNEGNTPLDIAIKNNLVEVVDALLTFECLTQGLVVKSLLKQSNFGEVVDAKIFKSILSKIDLSDNRGENIRESIVLADIVNSVKEHRLNRDAVATSLYNCLVERYEDNLERSGYNNLLHLLILNNMVIEANMFLDKLNSQADEEKIKFLRLENSEKKKAYDLLVENNNAIILRKFFEICPQEMKLQLLGFIENNEETILEKALKTRKFDIVFEILELKKGVEGIDNDGYKVIAEKSLVKVLNSIKDWSENVDDNDVVTILSEEVSKSLTSLFLNACLSINAIKREISVKERMTEDQRMDLFILASHFNDLNLIKSEINKNSYIPDSLLNLVFSPIFKEVVDIVKRCNDWMNLKIEEKSDLLKDVILSQKLSELLPNIDSNQEMDLFKLKDDKGINLLHLGFLVRDYNTCMQILGLLEEDDKTLLLSNRDKEGLTCLHYLVFSNSVYEYEKQKLTNNKFKNLLSNISFKLIDNDLDKGVKKYLDLLEIETIYEKDKQGKTALHYAAYFKDKDLCSAILIKLKEGLIDKYRGKKEDGRDKLNVWELAFLFGDVDAIELLESKIGIKDNDTKLSDTLMLMNVDNVSVLNLNRANLQKYLLENIDLRVMKIYLDNVSNKDIQDVATNIGSLNREQLSEPIGEGHLKLNRCNRLHTAVMNAVKTAVTSVEEIKEIVYILNRLEKLDREEGERRSGKVIKHEILDAKDADNNTVFHLAVDNPLILKMLYLTKEYGKAVSLGNNWDSPLHIAVRKKNIEAIKVIKEFAPNEIMENSSGKTPLDIAIESRDEEVVKLLFSFGLNERYLEIVNKELKSEEEKEIIKEVELTKRNVSRSFDLMLKGNKVPEKIAKAMAFEFEATTFPVPKEIVVKLNYVDDKEGILHNVVKILKNGNVLNEDNQKEGWLSSYDFCCELLSRYNFEMTLYLISRENHNKDNLLHLLISNNLETEAIRLLDKLLNKDNETKNEFLSLKNIDGKDALELAIDNNSPKILEKLFEFYSPEEISEKLGFITSLNETVLMKAIKDKRFDIVLKVLDLKDKYKYLLENAIFNNDYQILCESSLSNLLWNILEFTKRINEADFNQFLLQDNTTRMFLQACINRKYQVEGNVLGRVNNVEANLLENMNHLQRLEILMAASFFGDLDIVQQHLSNKIESWNNILENFFESVSIELLDKMRRFSLNEAILSKEDRVELLHLSILLKDLNVFRSLFTENVEQLQHVAALVGANEIFEFMLNGNVNDKFNFLKTRDEHGRTSLHFAFLGRNFALCNQIIDGLKKEEVNELLKSVDRSGANSFHYLVFSDSIKRYRSELAKNLLPNLEIALDGEYLAFLNRIDDISILYAKDNFGRTPLHYAVYFNDAELVSIFMEMLKESILKEYNIKDNKFAEFNLLELAYYLGDTKLIELLESKVEIGYRAIDDEREGNDLNSLSDLLQLRRPELSKRVFMGANFNSMKSYSNEYRVNNEFKAISQRWDVEELLNQKELLRDRIIGLSGNIENTVEGISDILYILDRAKELGVIYRLICEDSVGKTLLNYAIESNSPEMVKIFLDMVNLISGLDKDFKNKHFHLMLTKPDVSEDVAKTIYNSGVNLGHKDRNGNTILMHLVHVTAKRNRIHNFCKEILLQNISKWDSSFCNLNKSRQNILHLLILNNLEEESLAFLNKLIERKVKEGDLQIEEDKKIFLEGRDSSGKNILDYAILNDNRVILSKILELYDDKEKLKQLGLSQDEKEQNHCETILKKVEQSNSFGILLYILDEKRKYTINLESNDVALVQEANISEMLYNIYESIRTIKKEEFLSLFNSLDGSERVLDTNGSRAFNFILKCLDNDFEKTEGISEDQKFRILLAASYFFDSWILDRVLDLEKGGIDLNYKDEQGRTALAILSKNGVEEAVEYILGKGADVNEADKDGKTALVHASLNKNSTILNLLLSKDEKLRNIALTKAINWAIEKEEKAVIEFLLTQGIDINRADENGLTMLMIASLSNKGEMVEFLLSKGINFNAVDRNNKNAIMYASEKGHVDVLKSFFKEEKLKKSKVLDKLLDAIDDKGKTAMIIAVENGHKEVVEALLNKNIAKETIDQDGMTALMYACMEGKEDILGLLLNKNINISKANQDGVTALMISSRKNQVNAVNALLNKSKDIDKGAYINCADNLGLTALDHAIQSNSLEVIEILLRDKALKESTKQNSFNLILKDGKASEEVIKKVFSIGRIDLDYIKKDNSDDNSILMNMILRIAQEESISEIEKAKKSDVYEFCKTIVKEAFSSLNFDYSLLNSLNKNILHLLIENNLKDEISFLLNSLRKKLNELASNSNSSEREIGEIRDFFGQKDLEKREALDFAIQKDDIVLVKEIWSFYSDIAKQKRLGILKNDSDTVIKLALKNKNLDSLIYFLNEKLIRQLIGNSENSKIESESNISDIFNRVYEFTKTASKDEIESFFKFEKGFESVTYRFLEKLFTINKISGVVTKDKVEVNPLDLFLIGCFFTDFNLLNHLLESKIVDINEQYENGMNAVMILSQNGFKEALQYLISKGADISKVDVEKRTALILASVNKQEEIVSILWNLGADIGNINFDPVTALFWAIKERNLEMVITFLDKGVDPNQVHEGITALALASQKGHYDVVEVLLKRNVKIKVDINALGLDKWTALMHASKHGHRNIVDLFLSKRATLDIQDAEGKTALIIASENGKATVVNSLLNGKAAANIVDTSGRTALMYASENGFKEVVGIFLEEKNSILNIQELINTADVDGNTALMLASKNNQMEIVEMLLNKGAKLDVFNVKGKTALIISFEHGNYELTKFLISKSDLNASDKEGKTILMYASEANNSELVEFLIKQGVNVNVINKGKSALHLAIEKRSLAVIKGLVNSDLEDKIRNDCFNLMLEEDEFTDEIMQKMYDKVNLEYIDAKGNTILKNIVNRIAREEKKGLETNTQIYNFFKIKLGNLLLSWEFDLTRKKDRAILDLLIKNRLKEASILSNKITEVDKIDQNGKTALMYAIEEGLDAVVEVLIEKRAKVNEVDNIGKTAIMYAIEKGDKKIVEILMQKLENVNLINEGKSALHLAIEKRSLEVIEVLVNLNNLDDKIRNDCFNLMLDEDALTDEIIEKMYDKVNLEYIDTKGNSILQNIINRISKEKKKGLETNTQIYKFFKMKLGNLLLSWEFDLIRKKDRLILNLLINNEMEEASILSNQIKEVDKVDEDAKTALMYASEEGLDRVVGLLLSKRAEVGHRDKNGKTALMYASEIGSEKIVEKLSMYLGRLVYIAYKSLSNCEDNYYGKIFSMCSEEGYKEINRLETISLSISSKIEMILNGRDRDDKTALMYASEKGSKKVVELLLKDRAKVDKVDKNGKTALMYAIKRGSKEVVELLLSNKAQLSVKDENGKTALMYASEEGLDGVVELLIKERAKVNEEDNMGKTALMYASERGSKGVVDLLLKNGAEVDKGDKNGKTDLMYAVERGSKEVVEQLFVYFKSNFPFGIRTSFIVNNADKNGKTALMYAVERGSKEAVELLLKNRAEVSKEDKFGKTALMYASERGNEKIVELLLKNRAEVSKEDKFGKTALMYASERGNEKVVELLIENGANLNKQNKDGKTALMYAIENGRKEIIGLLLLNKYELRKRDKNGKTALMYASERGSEEVLELLIELSKKPHILNGRLLMAINDRDENGKTALMYACMEGSKEVVELLKKNGADLNIRDKDGKTILMYASESGNKEVVKLLIELSKKSYVLKYLLREINDRDKNGKTALMYASQNWHKEVEGLLIENGANVNEVDINDQTPFKPKIQELFKKRVNQFFVRTARNNMDIE